MPKNGEQSDDHRLAETFDQGQTDELVLSHVNLIERDFEIFLLSHGFSFEVPDLPDYLATPAAVDNFIAESIDDQVRLYNRGLPSAEVRQMVDSIRQEVFILKTNHIKDLTLKQEQRKKLAALASILAIVEGGQPAGYSFEQQTALKKRLQAHSIIDGDDPIWRELIAAKFPGESLTNNDTAILADVAINHMTETEAAGQLYESFKNEMTKYLQAAGEDTESLEARALIAHLIYLTYKARGSDNPIIYLIEARMAAINSSVNSRHWDDLITELFK